MENTDGEKSLHQWTKGIIAKVAELHASRFAASSTQHLIDANTANIKRPNSIYQEAALVAYMLWTRKTAMRLVTLNDMGSPTFDVFNSQYSRSCISSMIRSPVMVQISGLQTSLHMTPHSSQNLLRYYQHSLCHPNESCLAKQCSCRK